MTSPVHDSPTHDVPHSTRVVVAPGVSVRKNAVAARPGDRSSARAASTPFPFSVFRVYYRSTPQCSDALPALSLFLGPAVQALWGISLNLTSVALLCMGVGFSVDFSVHIAKATSAQSAALSRADAVKKALSEQGVAVLHAGQSTLIAVVVLGYNDFDMILGYLSRRFRLYATAHAL